MGLQALLVGEGILMKEKSANGDDWSTALYDWSTTVGLAPHGAAKQQGEEAEEEWMQCQSMQI